MWVNERGLIGFEVEWGEIFVEDWFGLFLVYYIFGVLKCSLILVWWKNNEEIIYDK